MSRIYFTVIFLLQFVCLQLEIPAQTQIEAKKPGTSTVSGRVTLRGEPFRNATVMLQPEQAAGARDRNASLQARTDQMGKYQINGVSAGRYQIGAYPPEFATLENLSLGQQGMTLNIGEGENIERMDLELKRGGVITGRITDANNRPQVEEVVQLMKLDQNGKPQPFNLNQAFLLLGTGSTDDRGIYRIYGLPEGRYLVSAGGMVQAGGAGTLNVNGMSLAGRARMNLPRTFHPGVTDPSQAKVIEVGEGSETGNVDISVAEEEKIYSIVGRIVSAENGQPVQGVEIAYGFMQDSRGINNWKAPGIRSNKNGEFRLQGILPGRYGLFARSDQENGVFSEIEVCEVYDRDLSGVEIKAHPGGTISGLVVIEGTVDPSVLAEATQIQLSFFSKTADLRDPIRNQVRINPEGNFYVRALAPGKVDIRMVNYMATRGFSILRIERNGAMVSQQEGIEIGPGEDISNVRVIVGYSRQGENR